MDPTAIPLFGNYPVSSHNHLMRPDNLIAGLQPNTYNLPKILPQSPPVLRDREKQVLLNPPVYEKVQELDDEDLLNLTDDHLFTLQTYHTRLLKAKQNYLDILHQAFDSLPSLPTALKSTSPSRILPDIANGIGLNDVAPPPSPLKPERIKKRLSKKELVELEQRQVKYLERIARWRYEQERMDNAIGELRRALEESGLLAHLREGTAEPKMVTSARERLERLRRLQKERNKPGFDVAESTTSEDSGVQITLTIASPPPLEKPKPRTTIASLPAEIVTLIFGYLLPKKADLLPCTLLSHHFNSLATPLLYRDISFGEDVEEEVDAVIRTRMEKGRLQAEDRERQERIRKRQMRREMRLKMRSMGAATPNGTPVGLKRVINASLGSPSGSPGSKVSTPGTAGTPKSSLGSGGYFDLPISSGPEGAGLTPALLPGGRLSPGVEVLNPGTPLPKGEVEVQGETGGLYDSVEDEIDGVKVKAAKKLALRPSYTQPVIEGGECCVTMPYTTRLLTSLLNPQLARHVRLLHYRGLDFIKHPSAEFLLRYPRTSAYGLDMHNLRRYAVQRIRELVKRVVRNLTRVEDLCIQGRDVVVANALMGILKSSGPHLKELRLKDLCLSHIQFNRGIKLDGLEVLEIKSCYVHTSEKERNPVHMRTYHGPPPPRRRAGGKLGRWLRIARRLWWFLDSVSSGVVELAMSNCGFPVEPILGAVLGQDGKLLFGLDGSGRRLRFPRLEALELALNIKGRETWHLEKGLPEGYARECLADPQLEALLRGCERLKWLSYHGQILPGPHPYFNLPKPHNPRFQTAITALTTLDIHHTPLVPFSLDNLLSILRSLPHLTNFSFCLTTGVSLSHVQLLASTLVKKLETFSVGPILIPGTLSLGTLSAILSSLGTSLKRLHLYPTTQGKPHNLSLITSSSDPPSEMSSAPLLGQGMISTNQMGLAFGAFAFQANAPQLAIIEIPAAANAATPQPQLPPNIFLGQMADHYHPHHHHHFNPYASPVTPRPQPTPVKAGDLSFDFDLLLRLLAPLRDLEELTLPYYFPPPPPVADLDPTILEARLKVMHPVPENPTHTAPTRNPFRPTGLQPSTPLPLPGQIPFFPGLHPSEQNDIQALMTELGYPLSSSQGPVTPPVHPAPVSSPLDREINPIAKEAHNVKLAFLASCRRIGRGFCASVECFPHLLCEEDELGGKKQEQEQERIWPKLRSVGLYVFDRKNITTVDIDGPPGGGWNLEGQVGAMGGLKSWAWEWERECRRRGVEAGGLVVGEVL
ncbi:hypothetical protein BJ508DRAFT_366609 [Ascobolus immersus RN42]|uniref:F-box domain-containing protein n=1 Tax=Ascobolus immersus RN42 TaxID=1160509 RepID=A0A3N4HNV2_ASCIM|nr:hypothetical protein BJ508DRAFT_366609 [Ascobolus immersus RN42]